MQGVGFGTANKIFLEFPNQWWEKDSAGFSFLWSDEDKEDFIKTNGRVITDFS